jgi:hypothetical protein
VTSKRIAIGVVATALLVGAAVLTAPHEWAGRIWCDLQGGEWTNRFGSRQEEIVTAGRTCVKE